MYDLKDWLQHHSHDIHRHVKPHCFKFENERREAVMFYRKWSSEQWMGPIRILKVNKIAILTVIFKSIKYAQARRLKFRYQLRAILIGFAFSHCVVLGSITL